MTDCTSLDYSFSPEEISALFRLLRRHAADISVLKLDALYDALESKLYSMLTIEEAEELLNEK